MSYSRDRNQLNKMLEDKHNVLYIDNDMCYVNNDETEEHVSFDFGPLELAIIFAETLGYKTSLV